MAKHSQKNRDTTLQKYFDFSKSGTIKYYYQADEQINDSKDLVELRKEHKIFKDYNLLLSVLNDAENKGLIKQMLDYAILSDGLENLIRIGNDSSTSNEYNPRKNSSTKRIEVVLTEKVKLFY